MCIVISIWMWLAGALLFMNFAVSVRRLRKLLVQSHKVERIIIALLWPVYTAFWGIKILLDDTQRNRLFNPRREGKQ